MKVSESDVSDAAAWIAARLNAMLEALPEDHPHFEEVSRNDRARLKYRRRVGESRRPRTVEVPNVGKAPALATMLQRFLEVQ